MHPGKITQLLLTASLLAGCAGYQGGFTRIPYLGDTAPDVEIASTWHELNRLRQLRLPDVELGIRLNDKLRTYETDIVLLVPARVDLSASPVSAGRELEVSLRITPLAPGLTFDPRQTVLHIGDMAYPVSRAWREDDTRWRLAMNRAHRDIVAASEARRRGVPKEEIPKTPAADPSEWRDPVDAVMPLPDTGKSHRFVLHFATPVPGIREQITLELGRSLIRQSGVPLPPIRFKTIRWSESHG